MTAGTDPAPEAPAPSRARAEGGTAVDGRRARGERSREAVVTAILEMLAEGVDRPGTLEIAERSGVSVRSVFRHFDDVESLYAAAIERHVERIRPLYAPVAVSGTVTVRARALAHQRRRLFEAMTPVRRAAERLRTRSPVIGTNLERSTRVLRQQVATLFDAELAPLEPPARRERVDALAMVAGWTAWNSLRNEHGCSAARAERVLASTVAAVVEG